MKEDSEKKCKLLEENILFTGHYISFLKLFEFQEI